MITPKITSRHSFLAPTVGLLLLSVQFVQAQFSINYTFNSGSAAAAISGADSADVTAGNFLAATSSGANTISSSSGNAFIRTDRTGDSIAAAFSTTTPSTTPGSYSDIYFEFTLSAATPGEFLNLDSFSFDHIGTGSGSYTSNVLVQSSVDGFGSGNSFLSVSNSQILVDSSTVSATSIVDLSGSEFNQLETITFQIRFYDSDNTSWGTNTGKYNRVDNIEISGVMAVPEPGTYALLFGFISFCYIGIRRRKS